MLPVSQTSKAISLAIGIFGLLFLPKVLIWLDAALRGRTRSFGGALRSGLSVLIELAFSSLAAPVFLMYQTRALWQILRGVDGVGWVELDRTDIVRHSLVKRIVEAYERLPGG